ncbi:MAG: nickel pincer cofactor biosynthesis protein LarB [Nitrospinae bacterium]|nr:nickel pincer cofactor biosynthesis protein LarB [Nitrospinota bacterium]
MNKDALKKLLDDIYRRKTTPGKALQQLKRLPYEDLGFARIDHHRALRGGVPEVIYCEGKSAEQVALIIQKMRRAGSEILATRLDRGVYESIKRSVPSHGEYNALARALVVRKKRRTRRIGSIVIATAGTSDIPVAEEAAVTADLLGSRVEKIFDVGVAGIHRLLDKIDRLRQARAVVVVAGMDGALASVVGGLIDRPVIAVPTSVGYGASFKGLSALLAMLNSCAAGVATVNIDNGFGAGCLAHKINLLGEPEEDTE